MTATGSNDELSLSGRIVRRLLDPDAVRDYAWMFVFAGWPILCSILIGADDDVGEFKGYLSRWNWTLLAVVLPAALYLLRISAQRMAPVQSAQPSEDPRGLPPIVQLIESPTGRVAAYGELRRAVLSGRNLAIVFIVVLVFHVFDMREVVTVYLSGSAAGVTERDWGKMFVVTDIPRWQNLLLVVSAYAVQFALLTLLFLFAVLIARHNRFFLDRVYQRRRVPQEQADAYIVIDLDDVDLCFGFRQVNRAFNVQVQLFAATVVVLLLSRFANVFDSGKLYSDFGQVAILAGCGIGLYLVTLPMRVKFLPLDDDRAGSSIVSYMREFFPERRWPYGESPDRKVIETLAGRFAANAFWPTGNNQAAWLFRGSFFALCYLLVPHAGFAFDEFGWTSGWSEKHWIVAASAIPYALFAVAATGGLLSFYRARLRYVDPRLVDATDKSAMTVAELNESVSVETGKPAHRIFISYRRQDSAAYAGRLRDSLEKHFFTGNIFFDLSSIAAGSDFVDVIEEKIAVCDVMLVIIGIEWLAAADENGKLRLGGKDDHVTVEITTALKRGLEVIPVLVGGARMPGAGQLPDEIAALSRINAAEISDSRWNYDVQQVVDVILATEPRSSAET